MLTVGSDPELMLTDSDGNLVNALDVVEGRKGNPTTLGLGGVIADNVNLEFSHAPATTPEEFVSTIRAMLTGMKHLVGDLNLLVQTSAEFPRHQMTHPESFLFGCEPEYDGWSGRIVSPPRSDDLFRSCGGHIHIGSNVAIEDTLGVVRSMDFFVGVPSVLLDNDPTSRDRQRLYGGSGKFRPTDWGAEYRVPGNFWISRPELAHLMHTLTGYAVVDVERTPGDDIRSIINTGDRNRAMSLLNGALGERLPRYVVSTIKELSTWQHQSNPVIGWRI